MLRMHGVILQAIGLDILKGSSAHVQRQLFHLHSDRFQPGKQLPGKMETRRGGRAAPRIPGVYGLILVRRSTGFLDIRWERGMSDAVQMPGQFRWMAVEPEQPRSILFHPHHLGPQPVVECHLAPHAEFPGRFGQDALQRADWLVEEEHLHLSPPNLGNGPKQPGRQHLGIVQYQHISLPQKFRQIVKMLVRERPALSAQYHQSGPVARRDGILGDQVPGQIIIEIRGAHILTFPPSISFGSPL